MVSPPVPRPLLGATPGLLSAAPRFQPGREFGRCDDTIGVGDESGDLPPVGAGVEADADPPAITDVRRPKEMLGIARDEIVLHAVGTCRARKSMARRGSRAPSFPAAPGRVFECAATRQGRSHRACRVRFVDRFEFCVSSLGIDRRLTCDERTERFEKSMPAGCAAGHRFAPADIAVGKHEGLAACFMRRKLERDQRCIAVLRSVRQTRDSPRPTFRAR